MRRFIALYISIFLLMICVVPIDTESASTNVQSFTAPLRANLGGTGQSSTPTNGQLLIGNGVGYTLSGLTGTTNQLNVTNGAGSITLSLLQDIHTEASPTFAGLTLTGFSGLLKATEGVLSTTAVADVDIPDDITLTNITQITNRSHTNLSDIGTLSHATIDSYLDQSVKQAASPTFAGLALTGFSGFLKSTAGVLSAAALADSDIPDDIALTNITQITNRSHTSLSDIGTLSHATIDSYLDQSVKQAASPTFVTTYLTGLTNGYVPYNVSTTGLTNSPVYTDGTNVGIGTTSLKTLLTIGAVASPASGTLMVKADYAGRVISLEGYNGSESYGIGISPTGDLFFRDSDAVNRVYIQDETGNLGLGTTNPSYIIDAVGSARVTGQFISEVATGTAPLSVTSTTLVSNLNAQYLNGNASSYYQQAYTNLSTLGGLSNSAGYLHNNGDGVFTWSTPSGSMTYPGAGIAVSTGSAWGTSLSVGTLTDTYLCKYSTADGLVCNTDPASYGMTYPSAGIAVSNGTSWGTSLPVSTLTDTYICTYSTANGLTCNTNPTTYQTAYTILTTLGSLSNGSGYLNNNGSGVLSWSTPSGSGTIGGSTGSTDNRLLRADGTGGSTVQASVIAVDDSGNMSGIGTISAAGGDFTVNADGDLFVTSLMTAKESGTAGSFCLTEANSTDTDCAGLMGPTTLSDDTSYVGQFPTAGPTSANMVQAWETSSSGAGSAANPYVHPTSWIDLDNYATLTGTQSLTNKTISTGSVVPVTIGIACSDETTALTTGTAKATFRMPHAMTLTAIRASVGTAPVGATIQVDINEGGTSILSTVLSIDASEKTSTTAETAAVISDAALADDAEITIDIDQIGSTTAGAGLKVWLIGTRTL